MRSKTLPRRAWLLAAMVAAMALFVAQSQPVHVTAQGPPDHVPNHVHDLLERTGQGETVRVIVETRGRADMNPVAQQARGQGAEVIRTFDRFPYLVLRVGEPALQGLTRAPGVVSISEDVADPPALDGSIPVIGADVLHELGWDGSGVAVAILDTGIDRTHPFFAGRVVAEACFSDDDDQEDRTSLCPDGSAEQTGPGSANSEIDDCFSATGRALCDHGPHVAGIAAGDGTGVAGAPEAGVAPGADIIAIQVFHRLDDQASCTPASGSPVRQSCVRAFRSDQIAALEHILEDLASEHNIAAANMSIGNTQDHTSHCDDDTRKPAIDDLLDENIATVISAGNEGHGEGVGRPGCISTAITVGATNNADTVFYNRGPLLDLLAPGRFIDSAVDSDGFGSKSGTSMAAPHVAGAWAVLRQAYPDMEVDDILELLQDTGVDITYDSGPGQDPADWENEVTTPRIDLLAAIQSLSDEPEINVDDLTVTVDEGDLAENSGTYTDNAPANGGLELSASIGEVTDEGGGEWSWSFQTVDGPDDSQTVTITATDNTGQEAEVTFELTVENVPPTLTIDEAEVTVDEGDVATNSGTFFDPGVLDDVQVSASIGEISQDSGHEGEWSWSFQTIDGPRDSQTVTITATDKDGDSTSETFWLEVENVAPTVTIDDAEVDVINEGDTLIVKANFTDPGIEDHLDDGFSATVVCYDVTASDGQEFRFESEVVDVEITNIDAGEPLLSGAVTAECPYGDTSESSPGSGEAFTGTVIVTDRDGGEGSADFEVVVRNVDPEVDIDTTDAVDVNGTPTFIGQDGDVMGFSARVTDPGSDDLFLEWYWDDDGETSDAEYLVDPPNPDPFPSPNVDPRDITDEQSYTFSGACLFNVVLTATDDDGGEGWDRVDVVITGDADEARSAGYWQVSYHPGRGQAPGNFDEATRDCYLEIVAHMSSVFDDAEMNAHQVLHIRGNRGDMEDIFKRQLLAAWLNFANGAIGLDDMVDTTGDGVEDTTFGDAIATAEDVYLDADSTRAELEEQKDILERINLSHSS